MVKGTASTPSGERFSRISAYAIENHNQEGAPSQARKQSPYNSSRRVCSRRDRGDPAEQAWREISTTSDRDRTLESTPGRSQASSPAQRSDISGNPNKSQTRFGEGKIRINKSVAKTKQGDC